MKYVASATLALALLASGCEGEPAKPLALPTAPSTPPPAAQPAAPRATPNSASGTQPAAVPVAAKPPPPAPRTATDDSPRPPASAAAATFTFDPPPTWKSKPVGPSGMRHAVYDTPAVEGAQPAEVIVFYFGAGGAGDVAANLNRWRGMFTAAGGEPLGADAGKQEAFDTNGMKGTRFDVSGVYAPRPMAAGAPAPEPKPGYRMLAAIVESGAGPYYFRIVGPEKTVEAERAAFLQMVNSSRMR